MNKQVIDGIRQYYQLPDKITDEQIAKDLKNSLGRAIVNLDIAKKNFIRVFEKEMPKILKRCFKLQIKKEL